MMLYTLIRENNTSKKLLLINTPNLNGINWLKNESQWLYNRQQVILLYMYRSYYFVIHAFNRLDSPLK